MADNPLNVAILNRWIIKGLDTSVAPLYLGTDGSDPDVYLNQISKSLAEGSAPNEEILPRARFVNLTERSRKFTPDCKVVRAEFMFYLFGTSMSQVKAFRELVRSVFENGHAEVPDNEDPFTIPGAEVSDLDQLEFEDHPERFDIKYSECLYVVQYQVGRNLTWPASVT